MDTPALSSCSGWYPPCAVWAPFLLKFSPAAAGWPARGQEGWGAGFKYSIPRWCPRETPVHPRIPRGGIDAQCGWVTEKPMGGGKEARARPSLTPTWPVPEGGTRHREKCLLLPLHRPGGKASWAPPTADAGRLPGPGLQGPQTRVWQDLSGPCSPGHWPGDGCGLGLSQDRAGAPGVAGPLSVAPSPPRASRTPAPFSGLWPRAE